MAGRHAAARRGPALPDVVLVVALLTGLAVLAVLVPRLLGGDPAPDSIAARAAAVTQQDDRRPQRAERETTVRAAPVTPERGPLPLSTTKTEIPSAPRDDSPLSATEGDVVRPFRVLTVHREPGGRAFARMPTTQFGDTWLPVVDRRAGWVQVLLPSRPNGSVGWLREAGVETARSPYLVRVHVGSRTMEVEYDGDSLGTWPVAVGEPATPTPTGRTFVLGSVTDPAQSFSPVILPLGSHSDTLDSYGGGPGTVAFHGWPDASVFGSAVSHGCIRVPAEALERLSQVPLGTLVLVDDA